MTHLVVHLGARKTGTSHAQRALGLNEAKLQAAGLYVPRAGRWRSFPAATVIHRQLTRELDGELGTPSEAGAWSDLARELDEQRPDVALITSETFEGVLLRNDLASRMLELLRACADRITVVLVQRDWLSFTNSLYCQRVKQLARTPPFEQFVTRMLEGSTRFVERLGPFLEAPDVTFCLIDYREIQASDPLRPLLRAAGIDPPEGLEHPKRQVNVSLGAVGIEAARQLEQHLRSRYPAFDNRKASGLWAIAERQAAHRGWSAPRFWGFSPAFAREVVDRVQPELDALALRAWGRRWPDSDERHRERCDVSLDSLDDDLRDQVLQFVMEMEERYLRLRDGAA